MGYHHKLKMLEKSITDRELRVLKHKNNCFAHSRFLVYMLETCARHCRSNVSGSFSGISRRSNTREDKTQITC